MTIGFVGAQNNGSGNGTTSATADLQSGSVGDLLVLAIASKYAFADTPSGWIAPANNQASGGAGSAGVDSGTAYMTVFVRYADNTEGATVTFNVTGGNCIRGNVARYSTGAGFWDIAATGGSDNTAGTAVSVTGAANPGITAGDWVVACYAGNSDNETFTSAAVAATGVTWGTSSERFDTGTTNGDDVKLYVSDHVASSGTASAAPVFTMTGSGTAGNHPAGAAVLLRIREAGIGGALSKTLAPLTLIASTLAERLGELTQTLAALTLAGGGNEPTRRVIPVLPLSENLLADVASITLRSFRNGMIPPAYPARRLADGLNQGLAQRQRVLFSKGNLPGLHSNFDSGANTDFAAWRFACHTGRTTKKIRSRVVFLPLPAATSITASAYARWVMKTGLTGAGTSTNQPQMVTSRFSAVASFSADELFFVEQEFDVSPNSFYRFELHQVNRARPVSGVVYEVPRSSLVTGQDYVVDASTFYQGGPATQTQLLELADAAMEVWRLGHPLFTWSADLAGDELMRTTASMRNMFDQTLTAPSATSPGWPVEVPYSGTIDSPDVPVVMWAYAGCTAGTGSITFRDQANNVVGTLAPAGAADWLSTTGVLKDASGSPETSKVDIFFQGDGTHTTSVYAAGMFMHSEAT